MMQINVLRTLSGHSGCKVELCREDDFYFVRKTSASTAYNSRLQTQIEKQRRLANLISVPKVFDQGISDGLLFFNMEYVRGLDFTAFHTTQKLSFIHEIVAAFMEMMQAFATTQTSYIKDVLFLNKIEQLETTIRQHEFFSFYEGEIERVFDVLKTMAWINVPATECHGDFTLENIIFTPTGEMVFIDLLDGELSSFWLDVAKLLYDLEVGWSLKKSLWQEQWGPEGRLLAMLSRYLFEEITTSVTTSFPALAPQLLSLKLLQGVRIIPYIKERFIFDNLVTRLDRLTQTGTVYS